MLGPNIYFIDIKRFYPFYIICKIVRYTEIQNSTSQWCFMQFYLFSFRHNGLVCNCMEEAGWSEFLYRKLESVDI